MRQRIAGLSGWFVAAVVVLVGAGGPNEVRTRRLVIEDGDRNERIVMEIKAGKPVVTLNDAAGRARAQIGLNGPHDEGYSTLYKHREMKAIRSVP